MGGARMITLTESFFHPFYVVFDEVVWQMTTMDRAAAIARRVGKAAG